MYHYLIDKIPPSNNEYIGRKNIWAYQEKKKEWQALVQYLCSPKPKEPLKKAIVTITYYFPDKKRRDPDNYAGKMILDGMVRAGILADDSFSVVDLRLAGKCDRDNPRTEITVEE